MYICINICVAWSVTSENSESSFKLKDIRIISKCNKAPNTMESILGLTFPSSVKRSILLLGFVKLKFFSNSCVHKKQKKGLLTFYYVTPEFKQVVCVQHLFPHLHKYK